MDQPNSGPLGDKDYQYINDRLRELASIRDDIGLAQKAGINCDERMAYCQHLIKEWQARKAAYFPSRP